jgi:hypothetical protein
LSAAGQRGGSAASRLRRTYFWRRVLLATFIAAIGAAVGVGGGWLVQDAGAQPSQVPPQHVYVARPGDTVWGIALRFAGGDDPRPLAYELEAQIGGGVLQPGDQLTVPYPAAHTRSG